MISQLDLQQIDELKDSAFTQRCQDRQEASNTSCFSIILRLKRITFSSHFDNYRSSFPIAVPRNDY